MQLAIDILNYESVDIDKQFLLVFYNNLISDRTMRLFAVWCAREVLKTINKPDMRAVNAVDVAERYANGLATEAELKKAHNVAYNAAYHSVYKSTYNVIYNSAYHAAYSVAYNAAYNAAYDAVYHGASREKQLDKLIEMIKEMG